MPYSYTSSQLSAVQTVLHLNHRMPTLLGFLLSNWLCSACCNQRGPLCLINLKGLCVWTFWKTWLRQRCAINVTWHRDYFSNGNNRQSPVYHRLAGDMHSTNECFIQVSSFIWNSLIRQSSPMLRPKKGTEGNSRRDSLITHSRYLSFFRSSVLMGRSDEPLQNTTFVLIGDNSAHYLLDCSDFSLRCLAVALSPTSLSLTYALISHLALTLTLTH